jgi:hypothetical protein
MKWISVKDKLPEIGKTGVYASDFVFAYDGQNVFESRYIKPSKGDAWWHEVNTGDRKEVTHWMPFPKPPSTAITQEKANEMD